LPGDRHNYVPAFDGLRGIAVVPIVLLHVGASVLPDNRLLRELTRGWYGVDLFFVLSGFLITRILLAEIEKTGTISVGRFYYRRFLRLMPAYVTMLTTVLVGAAIFDPGEIRRVPLVLPSLMTGTYNYEIASGAANFGVLVVIWSLCVEAQFYFLWPWVLRRIDLRRGLRWCLSAIALLTVYRIGLYAFLNWGHLGRPTPMSVIWIYFSTGTRIPVILIGCAAAFSLTDRTLAPFWRRMRELRHFSWIALIAAAICIIFVTGGIPSSASWRSATFGYTLAGLTTAALLVAVFLQPGSAVARLLSFGPLVSLGTVSYGVYLFHLPIVRLLLDLGRRIPWPHAVLTLSTPTVRYLAVVIAVMTITWLCAALHYRYVEQRVLRLRPDRPEPRPLGRALSRPDAMIVPAARPQAQAARESSFPAQAL
jgi:peptidoglycan/LPS O-acetylase OafA/YrhL